MFRLFEFFKCTKPAIAFSFDNPTSAIKKETRVTVLE